MIQQYGACVSIVILICLMVNAMMLVFNLYAIFLYSYILTEKLYIHIYICYIQFCAFSLHFSILVILFITMAVVALALA